MIKARRTSITPIVAVNGDVTEAGIARISTRCVGELSGTVGAGNPTWRPAGGTLPLSLRFGRWDRTRGLFAARYCGGGACGGGDGTCGGFVSLTGRW